MSSLSSAARSTPFIYSRQIKGTTSPQLPVLNYDAHRTKLTRPEQRRTIRVENVPRTALLGDLLRMVAKTNTKHIVQVQLNYDRFLPNGYATLTVSHPQHLHEALSSLRRASISEHFLHFKPVHSDPHTRLRNRGVKGRAEAAERQSLTGNGPDAGITERGRAVIVWGLPHKVQGHFFLKEFRSHGIETEDSITKVEAPEHERARTARAVVRLKSPVEAHRLVRSIHKTHYDPDRYGDRYEMQARVIY